MARHLSIKGFRSETHVMVGLWSSEVIYSVGLRAATVRAICPDPEDRLYDWQRGVSPSAGQSGAFVLLDPFARGRQAATIGLEGVLRGAHPRLRGHHEAAERLR